MQIADPPAFSLSGRKVPKSRNRGANTWIACRNSSLPYTSWRQKDVVFVQEFLKIFEFEFSVPLSGKNRSNKPQGIPSNTS